ncbi:MAG TPA: hypothetical protein VFM23_09170 [Gemmatimonadales bacterium]|nr:hypothetical protein [Gemmatimonadales bacterium]
MNEDQLIQAARQLGARAAERLDVQATARQVLQRLREQPVRKSWIHERWLRVAALVVVLLGAAFALRQLRPSSGESHQATHFIADDLTDLSTDELQMVLTSFDQIVAESVVPDSTSDLQELDAQQLRRLLQEG